MMNKTPQQQAFKSQEGGVGQRDEEFKTWQKNVGISEDENEEIEA